MSFWFVLMEYCWRERGRQRIKAPVSDGSSPGLQSVVIWWGLCLTPSCEIKAPPHPSTPPPRVLCAGWVCALPPAFSTGSLALLWCLTASPDESRPSASLEVDILLPLRQDCRRDPTHFDESLVKSKTKSLTSMSSYLEFQPRVKDSRSTTVWLLAQQT